MSRASQDDISRTMSRALGAEGHNGQWTISERVASDRNKAIGTESDVDVREARKERQWDATTMQRALRRESPARPAPKQAKARPSPTKSARARQASVAPLLTLHYRVPRYTDEADRRGIVPSKRREDAKTRRAGEWARQTRWTPRNESPGAQQRRGKGPLLRRAAITQAAHQSHSQLRRRGDALCAGAITRAGSRDLRA